MADEQVQKLLQGALKAAREGNTDQARKAFLYVLKMQPTNEVAWMGLATVAQDQREQVIALQKAVEINPQNARAQAALERIQNAGAPATPPAAPQRPSVKPVTPPPSPPPPPPQDEDEVYEDDEEMSFEEAIGEDDTYDEAPSLDDFYESEAPEPMSQSSEAVPPTMPATPLSEPPPTSPVLPETPLFSQLTLAPTGEEGVPVPKRRTLEGAAQRADSLVSAYLRQEIDDRLIEWTHKPRRRHGERDIRDFRLMVGGAIALVLLLVVGPIAYIYTTSPEYQKLVFAPTHTITPTLTSTPTNTPGATLTSSPTPLESSTPSPTLDPSVTPGQRDLIYRPTPTRIYFPPGVQRSREIEEADALINEGDIDEAVAKIEEDRRITALTGDFMSYYYLARIQMAQGDYEAAQQTVTDGRVEWEDKSEDNSYDPMIMVSQGRLQYYTFQQQIASGEDLDRLQQPIDEQIGVVQQAADLGGSYDEPYLLLADLYALKGDYVTALQSLTDAQWGIYRGDLFANTRLRLKKAELYRAMGNLDQALYELDDLLRLNPFEESALNLRMDIAMQKGDPGLAVIYAEAYQFYYPQNIDGYRVMGDAFVLENKIGQAMAQYATALQGDTNDPAYGDALASRAAVYASQGRDQLALTDLFQAVEIQPQNMDFRWQRYQLAYRTGDYALAAEDLLVLQTGGRITLAQFTILNTQIQIAQGALNEANGQQQALTDLRRLRPADVPPDLQPTVNELIARLEFALGDENDALNALDSALEVEDTASRRVLRGQILQAQAEATTRDDTKLTLYLSAQREYDFVLSWGVVYRYGFADDLQDRYELVTSEIERIRAAIAAEES